MSETSILATGLTRDTSAKLARLSERTGRDERTLIGEAVATYVDRELAIIEMIERGRSEIRAGLGLSTDEVFQELDAALAEMEDGRVR